MRFNRDLYQRGDRGDDVAELQLMLSGFRGSVADGSFGPGTELQVMTFQHDVMQIRPDGIIGKNTLKYIQSLGEAYPLDWDKLRCSCGKCNGFGNNQYPNIYKKNKPKIEAYHQYEYPGIHKGVIWATKAMMFYCREKYEIIQNSGYRCHENNKQHGRSSTNHMGKAIDSNVILTYVENESKEDRPERDILACNEVRGIIIEKCNFQAGWYSRNKKSTEPEYIAPTWIHNDFRCYDRKYLHDKYFIRSEEELFDYFK